MTIPDAVYAVVPALRVWLEVIGAGCLMAAVMIGLVLWLELRRK